MCQLIATFDPDFWLRSLLALNMLAQHSNEADQLDQIVLSVFGGGQPSSLDD